MSNAEAELNKNAGNSESIARLLEMTANSIAGSDNGRDFSTLTDKDGRFSFESIPSGQYPVSADGDRYVGVDTTYDHPKAPSITFSRANIAPGMTTEIVLKLIPAAVLSGRITDPNGNALANALVEVLLRTVIYGIPSTDLSGAGISNDLGEFRIFQLRPGEYFLSATPSLTRSLSASTGVQTFYPSVANLSEAMPVKLRPGEDLGGMNIQIRNFPDANSSPASRSQN